jgi:glutamate---cysteine ligase / carboxylate-amine ligase
MPLRRPRVCVVEPSGCGNRMNAWDRPSTESGCSAKAGQNSSILERADSYHTGRATRQVEDLEVWDRHVAVSVRSSDGRPRRGAVKLFGQTSAMRTVGVEEELLLVDMHTGKPRSVASQVIAAADRDNVHGDGEGGVEAELQRYMVETQSSVSSELADVEEELRKWRRIVAGAAREAGAGVAAIATAPVAGAGLISLAPRYQRMAERFGPTAQDVLTCGCHVHVSVQSDEEGIAAIDRIRVWLPVILAMSANSPFYDGRDTGYASYRSQLWMRWPSAGPTDTFGTPDAYHELVRSMVESGVLLDDGMIYFDARLSRRYPTVEIRVADVCVDLEDTLLVAALCRALVETAAAEAARGDPVPQMPTSLLRLAVWRAGHDGAGGVLVDPVSRRPRPWIEVMRDLVIHVHDSLEGFGDIERVEAGIDRLARVGTGATGQRRTFAKTGQLVDVVVEAVRRTAGR